MNCTKCKHYYVTWDPERPKGCKILGFKSKELPCKVVKKESGNDCLSFEEKSLNNREK